MRFLVHVDFVDMVAHGLEEATNKAYIDVPLNKLSGIERQHLAHLLKARCGDPLYNIRYYISHHTGDLCVSAYEGKLFMVKRPTFEAFKDALRAIINASEARKQAIKEEEEEKAVYPGGRTKGLLTRIKEFIDMVGHH